MSNNPTPKPIQVIGGKKAEEQIKRMREQLFKFLSYFKGLKKNDKSQVVY
jgi:hypothetical protein